MTSQSSLGQTRITLQFNLGRDINGAARDVQAAIVAARPDLPASLKSNPTHHKANPADAPILILALTSKTLSQGQLYDAASNVFQQQLSQVGGVGLVAISGSALPAVRVELNPQALFKYGIGLEDVRAALAAANANSPKGTIDNSGRRYQIYSNDQATHAADYASLIVAYRNSSAVYLSDLAAVTDSVEDTRNLGLANGRPSVLALVFPQPSANILNTISEVKNLLPHLIAAMPSDVDVAVVIDRSPPIRASLHDTEITLLIAAGLVTIVVFLFLRDVRATAVPVAAMAVSIIGTFGCIYLLGYSLDLLSLMALTIAIGFVVDDAIVVLENIYRHREAGARPIEASALGTQEVGFTVLSMTLSLLAVFLPILFLGGILGRLFREFAVTLSIAVLISLLISLTTIPMLSTLLIGARPIPDRGWSFFDQAVAWYERTLQLSLRHFGIVLSILVLAILINVTLFYRIPKGLFPQEDTGRLYGWLQADEGSSFQAMSAKLRQMMAIVQQDPAVENVADSPGATSGFGGSSNTGAAFISLRPINERSSADEVIARLQPKLAEVSGVNLYLTVVQDIRAGGRLSSSQYQYSLQSDSVADLLAWTPKLVKALEHSSILTDITSDQSQNGLEADLVIDRDSTARLGDYAG